MNIISAATNRVERERLQWPRNFNLKNVTRESSEPNVLAEFIGLGSLPEEWAIRRRHEMESGALAEPLLYETIYDTEVSDSLPEVMQIYKTGEFGVVMQLVKEGGEAKAISMTSSNLNVTQQQYAALLVYSKKLRMYNMLNLATNAERAVGVATNALLNHTHLDPILSYTYLSANKTAASAVGTTLEEKYMRTLEDAIEDSQAALRRGPYDLITGGGNSIMVKRILSPVPQQGFTQQLSAVLGDIENVIVYRGWSGTQGLKTQTYAAPTSGKAWLVDKSRKMDNFYSLMKQALLDVEGNPDVSRFIEMQTVWDVHFGVTAIPANAVQEITWPT